MLRIECAMLSAMSVRKWRWNLARKRRRVLPKLLAILSNGPVEVVPGSELARMISLFVVIR